MIFGNVNFTTEFQNEVKKKKICLDRLYGTGTVSLPDGNF